MEGGQIKMYKVQQSTILSTSTSFSSSSTSESSSEVEEFKMRLDHAPPFWKNKKMLSKQLSMRETPQDIAWERRRRQMLDQETKKSKTATNVIEECDDDHRLTDEDLSELRGSIELGFGFNEDGVRKSVGNKRLCNTLPALDLYFAVNRQLASPVTSPRHRLSSSSSSSSSSSTTSSFTGGLPSAGSSNNEDSWKLCSPGDSPQQMKTKLRHWAQAVACSVRQQAV